MPFRSVALPPSIPGRLWLAAMPGRFEPWPAFQAEARQADLGLVVCLTPDDEARALSPAYHAAIVGGSLEMRWMALPMPNFGVPDDAAAFRTGIEQAVAALLRGESVLLHCAAGMGRTGSAAACVLKSLGLSAEEALDRVREAGSNPQNAEQSGFVAWF